MYLWALGMLVWSEKYQDVCLARDRLARMYITDRHPEVTKDLLIGEVVKRNMRHVGIYKQFVTGLDNATKRLRALQVRF